MADFQMDFDIITSSSLEIVSYQHGSLAQASSADIIKETMSSEDNPENVDAEVYYIGLLLRRKVMS